MKRADVLRPILRVYRRPEDSRAQLFDAARPLPGESAVLKTLSRRGSLNSFYVYMAASSRLRSIPCVSVSLRPEKMSHGNGRLIIPKREIELGSLSWTTFLHEWCHWIVAETVERIHRQSIHDEDEEAACEAYARALEWNKNERVANVSKKLRLLVPKTGTRRDTAFVSELASAYWASLP